LFLDAWTTLELPHQPTRLLPTSAGPVEMCTDAIEWIHYSKISGTKVVGVTFGQVHRANGLLSLNVGDGNLGLAVNETAESFDQTLLEYLFTQELISQLVFTIVYPRMEVSGNTVAHNFIAIADTGTYLVMCPYGTLLNLISQLGVYLEPEEQVDCEEADEFPEIIFTLDGFQLGFPRDLYVE
ncbi:hypothetical protein X801_07856, partial [Opisthorchis viverrini]